MLYIWFYYLIIIVHRVNCEIYVLIGKSMTHFMDREYIYLYSLTCGVRVISELATAGNSGQVLEGNSRCGHGGFLRTFVVVVVILEMTGVQPRTRTWTRLINELDIRTSMEWRKFTTSTRLQFFDGYTVMLSIQGSVQWR
jgi:hypothetical protein